MTNVIHRYPRGRDQMSINLLDVWATSENLKQTLRSHKIRSTFYTDSTLHKVLWKLKDPVATEDKNYILYKNYIISYMCDIIIYVAAWWEKHLLKRSLIKHTCSWRNKLIMLLNVSVGKTCFQNIAFS